MMFVDDPNEMPSWATIDNPNCDICAATGSEDRSEDWQKYKVENAIKSGGGAIVVGLIIALILSLIKKG